MSDPPPPRRALALTWRLVAGYTLATLLTLTVAAVFLHRGLRRSFEIEDGELLSDSISAVRREVLKHPADLHETEELIRQSAGDRQIEKYYGRLFDGDRVVAESPGAAEVMPPPQEFPAPVAADQSFAAVTAATSPNGNPAYLGAALVARGPGAAPLLYQVALDTRHVEEWLLGYRHTLTWMVSAASLVTALLGWIITRRGLRPLQEITAAAQRITATGLDEHISGKAWPHELASLAVEFDDMLGRLRGSFERLSQFTADAAHEFRTPLNNLMGSTSLALTRPRSEEEYRALLETHLEEYHRLTHMMESLLFLARADHAQTMLKPQPLAAGHALHEVVEFFSALAEDRGIALECQGDGVLTADAALLRMALSNLVSNALRHSPGGTKVTLSAEPQNGDGLLISVRDEGEGIAAGHLPRLFDRFYRAEASRTNGGESSGGSGLGLALVKTIMQLHGGTATVESTAGSGSVFRLHFPSPPAA